MVENVDVSEDLAALLVDDVDFGRVVVVEFVDSNPTNIVGFIG